MALILPFTSLPSIVGIATSVSYRWVSPGHLAENNGFDGTSGDSGLYPRSASSACLGSVVLPPMAWIWVALLSLFAMVGLSSWASRLSAFDFQPLLGLSVTSHSGIIVAGGKSLPAL